MVLVTEEIDNALRTLSIPEGAFSSIPENEGAELYERLVAHFVNGGDRKWWWESFSMPSSSKSFADGKGFERITAIVPAPEEDIWFVAEEDQLPFYPIYETTPALVQRVIGECYAFEYYIVPKSLAWLLCENHHNQVIGVGEQITVRLENCIA